MSMKNPNDTIGNRTRDLPTCSAVPQPTALPRVTVSYSASSFFFLTDKLLAAKEGFFSRGVGSTVCIRRFIRREYLADTAVEVATIHGLAWINDDRQVIKSFPRNEDYRPVGCVAV